MSSLSYTGGAFQEDHPIRPDLSVVIVSWNVRPLLEGCLRALLSPSVREGLDLEIIVVDNASSDGSQEAAAAFPGVRVMQTGRNLGYGRANNAGLEAAVGRHLLVLNPDTVPQAGSLRPLLRVIDSNPEAGMVSPRLLNADGTIQRAAFRFPTLLMAAIDLFPLARILPGRLRAWLYGSILNGRYPQELQATEPFTIDHPLGACILLRREAFAQAGGFDPGILMYAEEIDLALRYHNAGWECWQVPESRVIHFGGQSTRQAPGRMFVHLWRSRLYLYRKHYSGTQLVLLKALLVASQMTAVLSALAGRVTGRLSRSNARKRLGVAGALLKLVVRA